jgi:hypothetical protein
VVSAATVAMQGRGKHASSTIEGLCSVRSVPRGYKKYKENRLRQLSFETLACQVMSFGVEEEN